MTDYKPTKMWWRHNNGEVYCDQGYQLPQYGLDFDEWFFDSDGSRQHVDDLFENEWDARQEAINFCTNKITEYQRKLRQL